MQILITAGPTREPLDPIRFLSNRSTGKMGFALAREAARRGHLVTLVAGPVALDTPDGVHRIDVVTAEQMSVEVKAKVERCEVLIMTAAVADWRPAHYEPDKIKKHDGEQILRLTRTEDILLALTPFKGDRVFVGFAAETRDLIPEAMRKLRVKGLDLMVANDASRNDAGFETDTNQVVLLDRYGMEESFPLLTKVETAARLLDRVESYCDRKKAVKLPPWATSEV
jgi:phosphopantothenoylcysteine decarboxylase/phosphopantothenate--cysteine ligase